MKRLRKMTMIFGTRTEMKKFQTEKLFHFEKSTLRMNLIVPHLKKNSLRLLRARALHSDIQQSNISFKIVKSSSQFTL